MRSFRISLGSRRSGRMVGAYDDVQDGGTKALLSHYTTLKRSCCFCLLVF